MDRQNQIVTVRYQTPTLRQFFIGFGLFLLVGIAIVAFVLSIINYTATTTEVAYTNRFGNNTQVLTGNGSENLLFADEVGSSPNISYDSSSGVFQVSKGGQYLISANFAVNVSGTGGGSSTPGPVTSWVQVEGQSPARGLEVFQPLSTTASVTNTQVAAISAIVPLKANDKFAIKASAPTSQLLLGGPTKMMSATLLPSN